MASSTEDPKQPQKSPARDFREAKQERIFKEAFRFLLECEIKRNKHSAEALQARRFLDALDMGPKPEETLNPVSIVPVAGKLPPTIEEERRALESGNPVPIYQSPAEAFHIAPAGDEHSGDQTE